MKYRLLSDEPISEAPQKENLGQRLVRNVAKIPALAYETARSGLGIGGEVAQQLHKPAQEIEEQFPMFKQVGLPSRTREKITEKILPTTEKAYKEAQQIFPRYYVEKKEGDLPFEFAFKEIPLLAYTGAFKSIPSLAKGIATSVGIFGGSEAGRRVGSYLGEQLGGERGKEKGEFLGGLAGGTLGAVGTQALIKPPSKFFKDKTYKDVDLEFVKGQKELQETRDKAFANLKKDALERESRIKQLEESRHPEYAKAEAVAKGIKEPAPQVKARLKKIEKDLGLGVELTDQKRITEMARQLEQLIDNNQLDLESAKTFKQRLNASLYDKTLSPVVKKEFSEMRNSLNEYISEIGKKHPEHGKPFESAEQKTIELKKLHSEEADFKRHQRETFRDIQRDYVEDLRNLKNEYSASKTAFKEQEKWVNNISPWLNKLTSFGAGGLGYYVSQLLGFGPSGKLISAFATSLLKEGAQEAKVYAKMLREHPDLIQEYNTLIKEAATGNATKIGNQINRINDLTALYEEPRQKRAMRYRLIH